MRLRYLIRWGVSCDLQDPWIDVQRGDWYGLGLDFVVTIDLISLSINHKPGSRCRGQIDETCESVPPGCGKSMYALSDLDSGHEQQTITKSTKSSGIRHPCALSLANRTTPRNWRDTDGPPSIAKSARYAGHVGRVVPGSITREVGRSASI